MMNARERERQRVKGHTRPVAPQQTSRASKTTIFKSFPLSDKNLAAFAPVIPHPTTTTSASEGRSGVVLCPSRNSSGSECQNDLVELALGNGHGFGELFCGAANDVMAVESGLDRYPVVLGKNVSWM